MIAAAPEPKANMGKPEPRYDGRLKVTGAARYSSDMPLNNPVFAFLVTSGIAKGRIEKLDLALARAVPGVLDILTQGKAESSARINRLRSIGSGPRSHTTVRSLRWCWPTAMRPRAKPPTMSRRPTQSNRQAQPLARLA